MELKDLNGLGPTRLGRLHAMGIDSLRDLLYFFPTRYQDQTHATPIREAWEGEKMIKGWVREKPKIAYFHGTSRVSCEIIDGTDGQKGMPVCWFNEPWMKQTLPTEGEIRLYGRIQVKNGRRSMVNPQIVTREGWNSVYRPIKGFPAKTIREMIRTAMGEVEILCPETLPKSLRERHGLIPLGQALRQIHFPESMEEIQQARRRIDFESMITYLMGVAIFQGRRQPGFAMEITEEEISAFWQATPFPPTGAQARVLREIAEDMGRETAMSRMVQGDVGCGKTMLAFGAIWLAAQHGYQSAMMAPTEVLARQHYESAKRQLEPMGVPCELLTGSTKAAERRRILKALKEGKCAAVFGTHALISEGVTYQRLGIAITDEQHRFGVRQRSRLQEKGLSGDEERVPHVLVMSATPIPRSLALILYGDLEMSLVDEMPPGRKPVKTRMVPEEKREGMYAFLRAEIGKGRQGYVVCPLVEDSESLQEVTSAKSLYESLTQKELKGLRVGLTWGTQKPEEKAETLLKFAAGEMDVLVATTVIEVGVNVPNATVMIIENAERYGLSQLHQLRGRVGRGEAESWCFLMAKGTEKLRILCETNDGFQVAQKDLEMRGPGDLMGTRQSGEAGRRTIGSGDLRMLDEAQGCVRELMNNPARKAEREKVEKLCRAAFEARDFRVALN